jgi:hypothetical protein
MALTSGFRFLATGFAISILSACGVVSGTGGNTGTPALERITSVAQPLEVEAPAAALGTFHGFYTKKENGETESGKFRMVVREQHHFKITGPFDVWFGHYRQVYHLYGKVSRAKTGAELLLFQVGMLGGYDLDVTVHATVVSDNLTGTGHGGYRRQGNYSHWTFKATKD